jgi:hypothetical protein
MKVTLAVTASGLGFSTEMVVENPQAVEPSGRYQVGLVAANALALDVPPAVVTVTLPEDSPPGTTHFIFPSAQEL